MQQFVEVLKIRNLPVDIDLQAKIIIEMSINEYDIVPFVPIRHKLRFHDRYSKLKNLSPRNIIKMKISKKTKYENETFSDFWLENMKKLSREFYFGKKRKFIERFQFKNKRFKFLPKYTDPMFKGDLCMVAEDMKSEMIAKILIDNHDNEVNYHFVLIDILASRPLTFPEYISLFVHYPETAPFIDAALGFPYERLFNKLFEENTGMSIPITIAPYLADVFITGNSLSRL